MQFLIVATNPRRFRWLTAWALMVVMGLALDLADWCARMRRKLVGPMPPP